MKVLLSALLLLLAPVPALAQPPISAPIQTPETSLDEEDEGGAKFLKLGLVAFGGANTHAMTEHNIFLDRSFAERIADKVPGGKAPQVEDGISGGAGIRMFLKDRFLVEVVYERVFASGSFGGEAYTWEVDANAKAFVYTVGVDILSNRSVRFGFAAGVGQYKVDYTSREDTDGDTVPLASEVDAAVEILSAETTLDTGSKLGQHYLSFVEVKLSPKVSLMASTGYRRVKLTDASGTRTEVPKDPRSVPPDFGSSPVESWPPVDWSGFAGRIALIYYVL